MEEIKMENKKNLEYKIGEIGDMGAGGIVQFGVMESPLSDNYRFVVAEKDNTLSLFLGTADRHKEIVASPRFSIEGNIVGGGHYYLDVKNRQMCLGKFSGDYGAIPREVAEVFSEMLQTHPKALLKSIQECAKDWEGLDIADKIVATPDETKLNDYWRK